MKEKKDLNTEENIKACAAIAKAKKLPEKNEIIILPGGTILFDAEGPLGDGETLGDQVGDDIHCG
jgi:hypothetical protein